MEQPLPIPPLSPTAPGDTTSPPGTGQDPSSAALAQGVMCGPWWLAFPFSWARSIVENVQLSEVPHAPAWLIGAANIEGKVVPVFDLAVYLDASLPPAGPGTLMLLGGEAEQAAAIAFHGLPAMARPQAGLAPPETPAALLEFVAGAACDDGGRAWALIDAASLMEALSAELALV
ncbi:chemotaxis protein CheW [Aquabacterium sp. A7-Y]|uniref:chemotaxis protein CheW n=1 Tax=Aquabacterium sp. A7-Y TaxID=1349605 RepID=UPI00223CBB0F|nr:chemotaxis protein CheW [Aquabacterium sp. A7-Y]MCW7540045.1 chemotaxis protein CheW [Aquabacterium sp. A7-Y]